MAGRQARPEISVRERGDQDHRAHHQRRRVRQQHRKDEREGEGPRHGRQPQVPAHLPCPEAIRDASAEEGADHPGAASAEGHQDPELGALETVAPSHVDGQEVADAVAAEGRESARDRDQPEGRVALQDIDRLVHARRVLSRLSRVPAAARRLLDGEEERERKDHPGHADGHECITPAEGLLDEATEQEAEDDSEVEARRIEAEGSGALGGRVVVADHRVRRRAAAGLTETDADPREQQLQVVLREPRERGHAAPNGDRERDDVLSIAAVRPVGDRNARGHIDQREGESGQQTELPVHQTHLLLDGLLQDHEDLSVDEVEGVGEGHHPQRVAGHARGEVLLASRFGGGRGCHELLSRG